MKCWKPSPTKRSGGPCTRWTGIWSYKLKMLTGPAGSDLFYSESNMKVLLQSIKEANEGKLTAHELIEV
ncbi:hypothetical protein AGMMS49579_11980 [Spirochaetia bacterium]|nr:hypothetical protein AGMMS49579_11980 [Spirochaetia bacterium]